MKFLIEITWQDGSIDVIDYPNEAGFNNIIRESSITILKTIDCFWQDEIYYVINAKKLRFIKQIESENENDGIKNLGRFIAGAAKNKWKVNE